MAPRRSTERLLAAWAERAASARIVLALAAAALAVLAVPGCGGGDSSSPSGTGAVSETSPATAGAKPQQGGEASAGGKAGNGQSPVPSQGEGKGKHGPKVAVPKGEREPSLTPQQKEKATYANIVLESPSLVSVPGGHVALPRSATCDGKNEPPTVRWRGVPDGTEEIVLMLVNTVPVNEALFFDWAIAGLDPSVTELKNGRLPTGSILGETGYGTRSYKVCPPKNGKGEIYAFTLYALPKALNPKPGFDPMQMREEALDEAGNAGFLAVSYDRY